MKVNGDLYGEHFARACQKPYLWFCLYIYEYILRQCSHEIRWDVISAGWVGCFGDSVNRA